MKPHYKEKIALVTGGNSGIGFATAQLLGRLGYKVFITSRNQKALVEAADHLGCDYIAADLSDANSIGVVCSPFRETGLDFLVNNAGIAQLTPIDRLTADDLQQHFSVNVYAPILLIKSLLPALKQRQGCVTNVSSVITSRSNTGFSVYAATKGALEAATKSLAVELAPHNIRVNAVCPGAIDTPIFDKMGIPEAQMPQVKAGLLSTIPLRRTGHPSEVADVICAQAQCRYVTGSIWTVDGGVSA